MRIILLTALTLFMASCDDDSDILKEKEMRLLKQYIEANNIEVEPQSSGLYFISEGGGTGTHPEASDWTTIRYTAKLINNRIFDSTDEDIARTNGLFSSSVLYGDRRIELSTLGLAGVRDGLKLMKEGEKATLIIPSHLAYGRHGTNLIPPYSTLIYDIELVRVIKDPVIYEKQMIDEYLAQYTDSTHLSVETKEFDIFEFYYIELEAGSGEDYPDEAKSVDIYYTGRLTDGRIFDTKTSGTPFNFVLGEASTIVGFEEAVKLMKTGGKSRVLIPSSLAYGILGQSNIPGYTPLVFDLELLEIRDGPF